MRTVRGAAAGATFRWPVLVAMVLSAASTAMAADGPLVVAAAEKGDRAAVLRLIAKGGDPNAPGPDGTTAIMYAAANDDLDLVRALIAAKANVSAKNQFGTTAITEASIIGSEKIIDALLKAGADPNTRTPEGEIGRASCRERV